MSTVKKFEKQPVIPDPPNTRTDTKAVFLQKADAFNPGLKAWADSFNNTVVDNLNALVEVLNQQIPYINTVADADAAIRAVYTAIAQVNTVSAGIESVNACATWMDKIKLVAENMAEVVSAQGYAEEAKKWALMAEAVVNVKPATKEALGLVMVGAGLEIDAVGVLSAKLANMLEFDTSGSISVKLSENFTVNSDGQIKINSDSLPSDTPIGSIIYWPGSDIPENWLPCNGAIIDQADYPELYEEISDRYNVAATIPMGQFQLPNLEKQYSAAPSRQTAGNVGVNASRIHINPINGDVWAFAANKTSAGAVSVLRAATGTWEDSGLDPTGIWSSIAFNTTNGDIWVTRRADSSEKAKISLVLRGGTGTWESAGLPANAWAGIAVEPVSGDVWAISSAYAYRLSGGTDTWVVSGFIGDNDIFKEIFVNNATQEVFAFIVGYGESLYKYNGTEFKMTSTMYGMTDFSINRTTGDIVYASNYVSSVSIRSLKIIYGGHSNPVDIYMGGFYPRYVDINQINGDIFVSENGIGIKVLHKDENIWHTMSNNDNINGMIRVDSITGDIFAAGSPVTVLRGGIGKQATPIIRARKITL